MLTCPKLELSNGPHSPLSRPLRRSQSGKKLLFVSVQVRFTVFTEVTIGLFARAITTPCLPTYRPSDALIAVRPLPNRSYDPPRRGSRSYQRGTSFTSSNVRSGTNADAGALWAGTWPLK